jgi:hypothetical protein
MMLRSIPVHLDSASLDAAAQLLGTTHPEETIERALSVALRLGDAARQLTLGSSPDPAQLCLLDEAALRRGAA